MSNNIIKTDICSRLNCEEIPVYKIHISVSDLKRESICLCEECKKEFKIYIDIQTKDSQRDLKTFEWYTNHIKAFINTPKGLFPKDQLTPGEFIELMDSPEKENDISIIYS